MNDDPLEPPPDWLAKLLEDERERVDDAPAMKDAVLRHLERSIAGLPPIPPSSPQPDPPAGEGSPPAADLTATARAAAHGLTAKAVGVVAVVSFAAGTLTGGAVVGSRPPATAQKVPASVAAASVQAPPPTASSNDDASAPVPAQSSTSPVASFPVNLPRAHSSRERADLARERELVDLARAALARENPKLALDTLERHARMFPNGALREERDAIRVQTLARAGRLIEADDAARSFHRAYPTSLLAGVVDAAIAARRPEP